MIDDENIPDQGPEADITAPEPTVAERPVDLPEGVAERFWDPETNSIQVDALLQSYAELEQRLAEGPMAEAETGEPEAADIDSLPAVPASPDDYVIEPPHELVQPMPELNKRLHEAGFTQEQAQMVYDLAAEHLLPVIGEVAGEAEAARDVERLQEKFGGSDAWRETRRQIKAWGEAKLDPAVYQTLSASYDGVLALHEMMRRSEPELVAADSEDSTQVTEQSLNAMIRDPRYWRDRDPEFIARVTDGFQRLFPS